jgi:hypothetical protein
MRCDNRWKKLTKQNAAQQSADHGQGQGQDDGRESGSGIVLQGWLHKQVNRSMIDCNVEVTVIVTSVHLHLLYSKATSFVSSNYVKFLKQMNIFVYFLRVLVL